MTGVLHRLFALLAMVGLFSALAFSADAFACPYRPAPAMQTMMHHPHHGSSPQPQAPMNPRLDCAACIAVLPPLPTVGPQALMPFAPIAQIFQPLSGMDPGLDPPPPRRA